MNFVTISFEKKKGRKVIIIFFLNPVLDFCRQFTGVPKECVIIEFVYSSLSFLHLVLQCTDVVFAIFEL